jgi:ribosome-binding factor A
MFTKRQNQYNKLIQKELGDILVKHAKEWFGNILVTVTIVRISSDLSQAKIYLSVLPFEKSNEVLQIANQRQKQIRGLFGNIVRHQVRHVPELIFYIDDTADFMERIDKALGK